MTHTEKVHVIFGLMAAVTGALALWSTYRPQSPIRLAWPVIAFLLGFFLFIPVEAQTRTYQEVGWWDTLLSAVPDNAEYWWRNWFRYLSERHVVQHKIGGLLIMVAAVIELRRAQGRLTAPAWSWALPVLLFGVGVAFGLHGGSAVHLPHRTEQIHHQILGVAFTAAALVLALTRARCLRAPIWQGLWAALILMVGLDITFFYRLSPVDRATEVHHHESAGTGMR